jgi:riboflavin biosynthesis pyrimidine reductase
MRLLLDETGTLTPGASVDREALARLYAPPAAEWLRVNFVSTLDGAASGSDGLSGSINTEADGVVFDLLRRLSDVVLVGAGTVRAEGYQRLREEDGGAPPLAVVSNSGRMPPALLPAVPDRGGALLITRETAEPAHLAEARDALGDDGVIVCGHDEVDLAQARRALAERGLRRILSEGGPSLFGSLLAAGVVDELDLTWVPALVGGGARPRITAGADVEVALTPIAMVESEGTVIGRWRVLR